MKRCERCGKPAFLEEGKFHKDGTYNYCETCLDIVTEPDEVETFTQVTCYVMDRDYGNFIMFTDENNRKHMYSPIPPKYRHIAEKLKQVLEEIKC